MPQGEEADPKYLFTVHRFYDDPHDFVRLGDLRIEKSNRDLDYRLTISFKVQAPETLDLSEGFLRDLATLLMHRVPRPVEPPVFGERRAR